MRVGVLKFGTVNWELAAMTMNGIDRANGIAVEIVPFAGEDASNVAIQSGDVDVIVSDWLWVSRLRAGGADLTFAPWSTAVGALMVTADSPIRSLADLAGRASASPAVRSTRPGCCCRAMLDGMPGSTFRPPPRSSTARRPCSARRPGPARLTRS